MTLDKNRVSECFSKLLPQLFSKLGKICEQYPEDFDGYLEFILQSIKYMRGETDQLPDIETDEYDLMIERMRIQLGGFKNEST